jgi:hypothetical protein
MQEMETKWYKKENIGRKIKTIDTKYKAGKRKER